jgi:hypothetical protein
MHLLKCAVKNRVTRAHALNAESSRGHCIFGLHAFDSNGRKTGVFHIVDLAGSERRNRTGTNDTRESSTINNSLMLLWNCLRSLPVSCSASQEI